MNEVQYYKMYQELAMKLNELEEKNDVLECALNTHINNLEAHKLWGDLYGRSKDIIEI